MFDFKVMVTFYITNYSSLALLLMYFDLRKGAMKQIQQVDLLDVLVQAYE